MRLVASAHAQFAQAGGLDIENEFAIAALQDEVERRGKTELNVSAIEATVYRHREDVMAWLEDTSYDLDGLAGDAEEARHLRAFSACSLESGSPNLVNALYVLRLEKRVAVLETKIAPLSKPVAEEEPQAAVTGFRLGA